MLHFIYNPTAGKGKAQRFRVAIEARMQALGIAYSFWETKCPRDATRIARELTESGEADIIAMGGDGTVNEVLKGLSDPSAVRMGVIPCGSGNDLAAVLRIPATPEGALDVLVCQTPKATDYLVCSGVRGLNVIGAGIDVEILRRSYRARFLRGSLNYFAALVGALAQFHSYRFRSEFNGITADHDGLIICACNGQRIGGGIPICPAAVLDDGQMDVVLVEGARKRMLPRALVQLMRGKILGQSYTRHALTQRLRVRFAQPATVQIDGELYDDLPFDVRIVPSGLKVYRP